MRRRDARGFSVVELIVVVGIIGVLSTFAVVQIGTILSNGRVDSAFQTTIQQLRLARQMAIDNRQIIVVTFTAPQTITVQQWPLGTAGGCSYGVPVNISTTTLPWDIKFQAESGIPTGANVPDGLGTGSQAFDLSPVPTTNNSSLFFQPDGSVQNYNCQTFSGVIYMSRTGQLPTARAVSIFGFTGRVKGYRFSTATSTWY
jgi:prepilin-type N-terminal cleavage/methylation domain-containing protein